MANDPTRREDTDGDVAVKRERKTERVRRYRVVFHNDDYTTKWFVVMVLSLLHADYATARATVARPWNALLLIAFVLTMFWHAVLGLQVVIEDYVHVRWKEVVLLTAIKFIAVLGALAGVLAVLRIALTP